ncbi:MAG: undecaprenyl-phosphate glucose phosphotransferase [Bacteroidaceae bacterium]|nr:undecaprenyl-phosphate glucose phosphotransferase [Bacteroidaceae bacterium]
MMGTEKNLLIGIFVVDTLLLTIFIIGFYQLIAAVSPVWVSGIDNLPWLLFIYIISFGLAYLLFPATVQLRMVKRRRVVKRVFTTCCMTLLFIPFIVQFSNPGTHISYKFVVLSILLYMLLLLLERLSIRTFFMHIRANQRNQKNVVLIGNGAMIQNLYEVLSTPIYGYDIKGVFYDGECLHTPLIEKHIGGINDIHEWLATQSDIHEIYGYLPKEQHDIIDRLSKLCDQYLIRFYYLPAIDVFQGNISIKFMEDIPIIAYRQEPLRKTSNKLLKRAFDVIISLLVLVFVFPWVWLWAAIMIRRQSPGPIFFKQDRTGMDGKVFKCIKFRSMKVNDEADKKQATKDDPRKFPFGDFMRRTNIDELPQFINVFKGDMSVVGPRPHMLKHTEEYSRLISNFMVRHFAKPGITGLAQVSGFRGETHTIDQMEGRVEKDIEYIENWSLILDIKIILKTITNILCKEMGNAY